MSDEDFPGLLYPVHSAALELETLPMDKHDMQALYFDRHGNRREGFVMSLTLDAKLWELRPDQATLSEMLSVAIGGSPDLFEIAQGMPNWDEDMVESDNTLYFKHRITDWSSALSSIREYEAKPS